MDTKVQEPPNHHEDNDSDNGKRWAAFASVTLAAWGYATSTTIANAMLPQIQGDLSASLDQVSWIVTAAVVASALGIPPTPWLASRFGLKNVLLFSLVAFSCSSLLIGFSTSIEEVVLWRITQSLFSAPLLVLSQTFTISSFGPERRGMAMAVWSVALSTGWVFGPAIGAYLAELQNWRWSFFMLTPVSAAAIFACMRYVPRSQASQGLRFDWYGLGTLSGCLFAAQMVLNRGQREDWFESTEMVSWAVFGVVMLGVYIHHASSSGATLISWRIFRDRNLSVGLLLLSGFAFISLAPLVLIPPMLEQLRGFDVVTIGVLISARGTVQIVLTFVLGRYIARLDGRIFIGIGFLSYAVGSWMMSKYNLNVGIWDIVAPQLLHGVSVAFIWMPVFHMLYSTLDEEYRTDAATMVGLVYNLVSSAGVAILVVVLSRSLQINTEELGSFVTLTSDALRGGAFEILKPDTTARLAAIQAEITAQAMMISYVNVFWLLTLVALGSMPLLLLVPAKGNKPQVAGEDDSAKNQGPGQKLDK